MDRFDEEFKNFMKDEFIEIKATPEFKKEVFNNIQNKKPNIISRVWNYEMEIDIRAGIAAAILIILLPSLYVFNKVHEIKKSESKVYTEEKRIVKEQ